MNHTEQVDYDSANCSEVSFVHQMFLRWINETVRCLGWGASSSADGHIVVSGICDYLSFPGARSLAGYWGTKFIPNKIRGESSSERGSVVSVEN
jgi:hypothetical protein